MRDLPHALLLASLLDLLLDLLTTASRSCPCR